MERGQVLPVPIMLNQNLFMQYYEEKSELLLADARTQHSMAQRFIPRLSFPELFLRFGFAAGSRFDPAQGAFPYIVEKTAGGVTLIVDNAMPEISGSVRIGQWKYEVGNLREEFALDPVEEIRPEGEQLKIEVVIAQLHHAIRWLPVRVERFDAQGVNHSRPDRNGDHAGEHRVDALQVHGIDAGRQLKRIARVYRPEHHVETHHALSHQPGSPFHVDSVSGGISGRLFADREFQSGNRCFKPVEK